MYMHTLDAGIMIRAGLLLLVPASCPKISFHAKESLFTYDFWILSAKAIISTTFLVAPTAVIRFFVFVYIFAL